MPSDCAIICPTDLWLSALRSQGLSLPGRSRVTSGRSDSFARRPHCDDLTSISRLQATAFARHLGEQVGTVTDRRNVRH